MINENAEFEWRDGGVIRCISLVEAYRLLRWFYSNWYCGREELEAELAKLRRDGPPMERGSNGNGEPVMGCMREVLEDYKQAADVEARLGDEARHARRAPIWRLQDAPPEDLRRATEYIGWLLLFEREMFGTMYGMPLKELSKANLRGGNRVLAKYELIRYISRSS